MAERSAAVVGSFACTLNVVSQSSVCFTVEGMPTMSTFNVLLFLATLVASAVLGCVPDDDNSLEARCSRRAFACHNSCYKASQGAACHACCDDGARGCKTGGSFSFYSCPDKD